MHLQSTKTRKTIKCSNSGLINIYFLRVLVDVLTDRLAKQNERLSCTSSHSAFDLPTDERRTVRKFCLNRAYHLAGVVPSIDDQILCPGYERASIRNFRSKSSAFHTKAKIIVCNEVLRLHKNNKCQQLVITNFHANPTRQTDQMLTSKHMFAFTKTVFGMR
jgi:hypothetical protein